MKAGAAGLSLAETSDSFVAQITHTSQQITHTSQHTMALQMGGGGGAMMNMNAPMPMQAMPNMQTMPAFEAPPGAPAAPAAGGAVNPLGDTRAARVEDEALAAGGGACLSVEFSGATVRAACWDPKKKRCEALPFSVEKTGACAAALGVPGDVKELKAWAKKAPKARAAEPHLTGVAIGSTEGDAAIVAPGLWLGARAAPRAWAGPGLAPSRATKATPDAAPAFGAARPWGFDCGASDERKKRCTLDPALAVGLLLARPRQRATQLVRTPVRRATLVAPGTASLEWRVAAAAALGSVDARAALVVDAPVALLVGACYRDGAPFGVADVADLEGVGLVIDCGCGGVDAAAVDCKDGAFEVLASAGDACEASRGALLALATGGKADAAALAALAKAAKRAAKDVAAGRSVAWAVVRGDCEGALDAANGAANVGGERAVVVADAGDAALGAAVLTASDVELSGAPEGLRVAGAVRRDVAAALLGDDGAAGDADVLFEAGAALPCAARRTYERRALLGGGGEDRALDFAFLEKANGGWRPVGDGLEDPFETVNDDEDVVYSERATVEYSIDGRGMPSAVVLTAAVPINSERKERKDAEKRCYRLLKYCLVGFFCLPVIYTLFHMQRRSRRLARTTAALRDFYARAKPDKVDSAEKIAAKYDGFEEILFKRLEATYPGHLVIRPGAKPVEAEKEEDAATEEEEEDVQEL